AARPIRRRLAHQPRRSGLGGRTGTALAVSRGSWSVGAAFGAAVDIAQGRTTFEQVINDPDSLADLPAIQLAAAEGRDLYGEAILTIVWNAYRSATGNEPPRDTFTIRYPDLDPEWPFDDHERIAARLPRIARLSEFLQSSGGQRCAPPTSC
ncbi:DUF4240 domain-containing protein, partial [Streptomyces sp. NPDC054952]